MLHQLFAMFILQLHASGTFTFLLFVNSSSKAVELLHCFSLCALFRVIKIVRIQPLDNSGTVAALSIAGLL